MPERRCLLVREYKKPKFILQLLTFESSQRDFRNIDVHVYTFLEMLFAHQAGAPLNQKISFIFQQ